MFTVVQFTGTLNPGTSGVWFVYGSPRNWFVNWSARPLTPNSKVGISVLEVEQAPTRRLPTGSVSRTRARSP